MNSGQASVVKSAPMLLSKGRGRGALDSVGSATATLARLEVDVELELCDEVLEGAAEVEDSSSSSSFSCLGTSSTTPLLERSPET